MQRRVDPSAKRFSRRTRGMDPSLPTANTKSLESVQIQDISQTSHATNDNNVKQPPVQNLPNPGPHRQNINHASTPSVHSVYYQNTELSVNSRITRTNLFPTTIPYQHPLNAPNTYATHPIQTHQPNPINNLYESRPPLHPMIQSNMQANIQQAPIQPSIPQSINQHYSHATPQNFNNNPTSTFQHQQQVPYHSQMMSNQITDLTRTNIESQRLIANLQSQITQLLNQQNQMMQTVIQHQQMKPSMHNVNSKWEIKSKHIVSNQFRKNHNLIQ